MATRFAEVTEDDGVLETSAEVNGLILSELRFPSEYLQAPFEPERPYLALVLEGGMVKSFRTKTLDFGRGSAFTMPAGHWHGARFGPVGSTIVIIRPRSDSTPLTDAFRRFVELRGRGFSWLAWRLAGELRASDAAAPLAAEGLALEILAATTREAAIDRRVGRPPSWLPGGTVPAGADRRLGRVDRACDGRRSQRRPPGARLSRPLRDLGRRVRPPPTTGLGCGGDRP
jgi:hypothetical protein